MDVLQTLPVWAQLLIVFLVAGLLILMNVGWLLQARAWLERQKQRRTGGELGTTTTPGRGRPPAERPKRDSD
jgi:hypothetical protein